LARVAAGGADLLVRTLDGIEDGSLQPVPQPAEGVSLAPKLTVEDARVDWTAPAVRVDRQVRGCTPDPGAWSMVRGERLKLGPVDLAGPGDGAVLGPGEIEVNRRFVRVGTGTSAVRLGEVQPPGRRAMPAVDWARGARLGAGERFTS
jgi:methionyl-tRNA formyltransferase